MRNELGDARVLGFDERLGGPIELIVRKSFELDEVGLNFFDQISPTVINYTPYFSAHPERAPGPYERAERNESQDV